MIQIKKVNQTPLSLKSNKSKICNAGIKMTSVENKRMFRKNAILPMPLNMASKIKVMAQIGCMIRMIQNTF